MNRSKEVPTTNPEQSDELGGNLQTSGYQIHKGRAHFRDEVAMVLAALDKKGCYEYVLEPVRNNQDLVRIWTKRIPGATKKPSYF